MIWNKYLAPLLKAAVVFLVIAAIGGFSVHQILLHERKQQEEIDKIRQHYEDRHARIQRFLDTSEAEKALVELDQLKHLTEADKRIEKHVLGAAARLAQLSGEIEALEVSLREEAAKAASEKRLAEILADCPRTINSEADQSRLEKCLGDLDQLGKTYPRTPAARTASQEHDRIRETIKTYQSKLRRARETFLELESKVGTFLGSTPPNFLKALETWRGFPLEFAGTPEAQKCQELENKLIQDMEAAAGTLIAEAIQIAGEGKRAQALQRLEQWKVNVEGRAREQIEAALQHLKN